MKKVLFTLFIFILCIINVKAGTLKSITIDGKTCSNTSNIEECLNSETYSYDNENKILTLNNYNGERIYIARNSTTTTVDSITIHLKGKNIVTNNSTYTYAIRSDIALTITSDEGASLEVNNHTEKDTSSSSIYCSRKVTIEGGNILLKNTYDYETTTNRSLYGISASNGVHIKNNANVEVDIMNDYNNIAAFVVGGTDIENPPIYIEKNASLKTNLVSNNVLKSTSYIVRTYTYYSGTVGEVDVKAEGKIEEKQSLHSIYIDGKKCLSDTSIEECVKDDTYSWDEETKTLTLNNYDSGRIRIEKIGLTFTNKDVITVNVKGNNKITENSGYSTFYSDYDTIFKSDANAKIEINQSRQADGNNSVLIVQKLLTIDGVNMDVNNTYNYNTTNERATNGIEATCGVIMKNKANVNININTDYSRVNAILVGDEGIENPKIYLDESSSLSIKIDAKNKLSAPKMSLYNYSSDTGIIGSTDKQIKGKIEEPTFVSSITIDGKKCDNNGNMNACLNNDSYTWDDKTKTLKLKKYNGGRISIDTVGNIANNTPSVNIHLEGDNVINENSKYNALNVSSNLNISAEENATLTINHSRQAASTNTAVRVYKLLTILGGNITVNNKYDYDSTSNRSVYAIQGDYGVIIKNNSVVTLNVENDYSTSAGIVVGGEGIENPKIYVEKPAKLELNILAKNKLKAELRRNAAYLYITGTIGEVDKKTTGEVIENTPVSTIYIDDKQCKNDGDINKCLNSEKYVWDEETNTLTLNNYDGKRIHLYIQNTLSKQGKPIKIYLKGNNKIEEKSDYYAFYSSGNLVIDGDENSSLDIIYHYQGNGGNSSAKVNNLLTIQGGNINITNGYEYDNDKSFNVYALEALYGIIIKDNAKVKLNTISDYAKARGMVVGGEGAENPKIYIEEPASLEVNLEVKNKLNEESVSLNSFTYYTGTIGNVDIKKTGKIIESPSFQEIIIDGKKCINDANIESCLSSDTYSYNIETNTLTLKNYKGNHIKIHSSESNFGNLKPLKVHLIGNNEIISETDYDTPFEVISDIDIIISAEENATLNITRKCPAVGSNVAMYINKGDLTIESGKVTINNTYLAETDDTISAYGIYAYNVNLKGNSDLSINVFSDYSRAYGILFAQKNNSKLSIESTSKLEITAYSSNKTNSDKNISRAIYNFENTEKPAEIIYISNSDIESQVYAGNTKEDSKIVDEENQEIIDFSYFKVEQKEVKEEIENPKTSDNLNMIMIIFVSILLLCIPGYIIIKKRILIK